MTTDAITPETMRPDLSEQRGAILDLMVTLERELERNERILTALNEIKRAGRWAAFTDDELDSLACGLSEWIDDPLLVLDEWAKPRLLLDEIHAEELRRRGDATGTGWGEGDKMGRPQ